MDEIEKIVRSLTKSEREVLVALRPMVEKQRQDFIRFIQESKIRLSQ